MIAVEGLCRRNYWKGAGYADRLLILGKNVYIESEAEILRKIKIEDNTIVNNNFLESRVSVVRVPAKIISYKGTNQLSIDDSYLSYKKR